MGRSSHHKERDRTTVELSKDNCLEGTSARTRPLSFDEILVRRENKEEVAKKIKDYHGGMNDASVKKSIEKTSENPILGRQKREDAIVSGLKNASNDTEKISSRKTEVKEDKLVKDKEKETSKSKDKMGKKVSRSKAFVDKTERRSHGKRKKDGWSSGDSENESSKLPSGDLVRKGGVSEIIERKSEKDRERQRETDIEDRLVHIKKKSGYRLSNDPDNESARRHGRGMVEPDKRSRGNSEKESKRKHRNEDENKIRDIGREHHPETIKDATRVHYEESRQKRRRSRSREREKNRARRSPSHSPRTHKHTSKDTQEQGELSLHSSRNRSGRSRSRDHDKNRGRRSSSHSPKTHKYVYKDNREQGELSLYTSRDRSGRSQSDVDRKRILSNGSSSHYRQHGGSSSRLGGYSPRKRKTDTAAKTPSPTRRSPERRSAGWDLPPVGKESKDYIPLNPQSSGQIVSSKITESPKVPPVVPKVVKPENISFPPAQIHVESIQLTQATRPMRRLYVENLSATASEKALMECVNNFLLSSGVNHVQGTHPCISCIINKEKGQALLEFLTPEDASTALSFDGKSFDGSILKLRRPKDYSEVTTGAPYKSVGGVHSISDIVEDSPHKIFIGGISNLISSEMLLEIARAFGPVKAYHFESIANFDGQCAFLEYVDHSVTLKACAGLNGMSLGGHIVTAVQAIPRALSLESAGKPPFYGIPEHAKPLLKKPTNVLKLKHVVDSEGLSSLTESEEEEILEDIRLECSRFGTVKSVNIVKAANSSPIRTEAFEVNNKADMCDREFGTKRNSGEMLVESMSNGLFGLNGAEPTDGPKESEDAQRIDDPKESEDTLKTFEGNSEHEDNPVLLNLLNTSGEPVNIDQSSVADNSLHHDKLSGNHVKDEVCDAPTDDQDLATQDPPCMYASEGLSEQFTNQQNNLADNSMPARVFEMENKPVTEEELRLPEFGAEVESAINLDNEGQSKLDAPEKNDQDRVVALENIFEPGSVLVEYKRVEACCMAAHCLHGRLFDGRVVTVEYVAHDLFHMRFCRGERDSILKGNQGFSLIFA